MGRKEEEEECGEEIKSEHTTAGRGELHNSRKNKKQALET